MPRIWSDTIKEHRQEVHDAVLDAAGTLAFEVGLAGVTMSAVAEKTGIGRATLYKYFPSVDAILQAWHARMLGHHLVQLRKVVASEATPIGRLRVVARTYATNLQRAARHGDIGAALHATSHALAAEGELTTFLSGLIADAAHEKAVRTDVRPDELALYCLNALAAARATTSGPQLVRLVEVVMAGLGAPTEL